MIKADALYYPHIGFDEPDWVKGQAMLFDQVYRIVPQGVIPDDATELQPLLEDNAIGAMIDPVPYAAEASSEFLANLESWDAAALTHEDSEEKGIERIHSDKTDQQVRRLFAEVGYEDRSGWLHVPTELASNYMLYLARVIATKNNLELVTENWAPWTATSYFDLNGRVSEFLLPVGADLNAEVDPYALFSLIVSQTTPINISEIPAEKIREFRSKRAPEIASLRAAVSDLHSELQKLSDPVVRENQIMKCVVALRDAQDNYRRSADIIKAKGWFGVTLMGFTAPTALAQLFNIPSQQTTVLTGTALALGGIFNVQNTRNELIKLRQNSTASCLVEMTNEFRNYTSARGGGDINFHAYNCMEEYVND
jgi:hypothetical protein